MDVIKNRYLPSTTIDEALCQWYLPTVKQTPEALGKLGIVCWVFGCGISAILFGLFCKQTYFIYKSTHRSFTRHLFGVTSMYVVMALMTSLGSFIPRAHSICSAAKDIYMSIGISHFVKLTLAMYAGEKNMASHVEERMVKIRKIPIFFCCFCIPTFTASRSNVRILRWITYQMKWTQAAYYFIKIVVKTSQEDSIGVVAPGSQLVYLNILNVFSFLPGVVSLICIGNLVRPDLQEPYRYTSKGSLVRLTILTTKLQRLLFDILDACGVFPCYPPLVSTKLYKNAIKDFIYLIEVFILGVLTFVVYSGDDEFVSKSSIKFKRSVASSVARRSPSSTNSAQRVTYVYAQAPESNC